MLCSSDVLLTRSPAVVLFVCSYLSFRLLGSALPLLSVAQLKEVLSGGVMMHYGEHVVSAQVSDLVWSTTSRFNISFG